MRPQPGEQFPPGPELYTSIRARNEQRLLDVSRELDVVADVATGKLIQSTVPLTWLQPLAAEEYGETPSGHLVRWYGLFGRDELETVRRARNNILYRAYLSDTNVAAATEMAERLLDLAKRYPPDAAAISA